MAYNIYYKCSFEKQIKNIQTIFRKQFKTRRLKKNITFGVMKYKYIISTF